MPLYKFYRIVPKDVTQIDYYIGHTTQPLRKRFAEHIRDARNRPEKTTSHHLIDRYGKDGLEIVLIHELELPDKEYARREERRLWEEVKENAVNRCRPWRSEKERKEGDRIRLAKWSEENSERVLQKKKEWEEANRERIKEVKKVYRKVNKERCREAVKKCEEANKERYALKRKEWYARESALKYLRRLLLEQ